MACALGTGPPSSRMADQNNALQIPWGSLAVVAALVSSALLVPLAFQPLRPAEKERAQLLNGADLEVDARLWEDPFVAARRHEAERSLRCERDKAAAAARDCDPALIEARRSPQTLRQRLDSDGDGQLQEALILVAMVPGNPFVGAEESRRRTRLALLAGLFAEGYRPENVEHIGLLKLEMPAPRPVQAAAQAASASLGERVARMSDRLLMPYELLSHRSELRRAGEPLPASGQRRPFRHIAVLWLDEAALPSPKADAMARSLAAVAGACARPACPAVVMIGPSSSDALQSALLSLALERRAAPGLRAPGACTLVQHLGHCAGGALARQGGR
jgi:hypothetical protein